MKFTIIVLLGLAALAVARPDSILDLDLDDIHHDQDSDDNRVITGSYSWTAPDGNQYFVKYIADEDGYRVLESNAVPVTAHGVRANGQQGSFFSSEESVTAHGVRANGQQGSFFSSEEFVTTHGVRANGQQGSFFSSEEFITAHGVRANGQQGSFFSSEEFDD